LRRAGPASTNEFPKNRIVIIRPTETQGAATGARKFLTAMGLFKGQSPKFFKVLTELADAADKARHGV
jgi:hypothetical protein